MSPKNAPVCCPPKSTLAGYKVLPPDLVEKMERTFNLLSTGTRIRLLHVLSRNEGLSVGELAKRLGMKLAGISNHLRLMAAMGVVGSRQEGNEVIYFMVDPCVVELLDKGACLALDAEERSRGR